MKDSNSMQSATSPLSHNTKEISYVRLDERTEDPGTNTLVKSNYSKQTPGEPGWSKESHASKPYRTQNFDPKLEFSWVSWTRTMINFLNLMIGTMILALPYAMKKVGLSAPLVMVFAVLCIYWSMVFLIDSLHENGDRTEKQLRFYYWHATTASFGKFGTFIMANYTRFTLIMLTGLSLVVAVESMNDVWEIGSNNWKAIFCVIIILEIVICPDMKLLAWISSIGIVNTIVCCVVLVIVSIDEDVIHNSSLWYSFKSYTFFDVEGFFFATNIIVASFTTCLYVPTLYMEMEEKHRVDSLLRWGHVIPLVGKLTFMVSVFYTYQEDTQEIAILNVGNSSLRTVLAVCIVVDKLVTIPLWIYPNKCELHTFLLWIFQVCVGTKFEHKLTKFEHISFIRSIVAITESLILLAPSLLMTVFFPSYWEYSVLIGCIVAMPLTLIVPNIQWYILAKHKPIWKQLAALGMALVGTVLMIGGLLFLE